MLVQQGFKQLHNLKQMSNPIACLDHALRYVNVYEYEKLVFANICFQLPPQSILFILCLFIIILIVPVVQVRGALKRIDKNGFVTAKFLQSHSSNLQILIHIRKVFVGLNSRIRMSQRKGDAIGKVFQKYKRQAHNWTAFLCLWKSSFLSHCAFLRRPRQAG